VTIPGDETPLNEFDYGVNCHQIEVRLNSAFIFTVTAMSGGLFEPPEGCSSLLGAIIIVLPSFFAKYFEPSIVYIFSLLVEIPLGQSEQHCKANYDVFSILGHQLHVLFPLLGAFVAVLDGCPIGKT